MNVTIQLVRHGMTKGNLEKRFAGGKTDDPLCERGVIELNAFCAQEIYDDCMELFASPMKRCIETASIIFPGKKINIIEEFRELDFGLLENKNHEELNGNAEYQKWLDSNGRDDVPGGETFHDFGERLMKGFCKMLSLTKGNKITAVVHGGIIMGILSILNGGNYYDYICKNGRGYVMELSVEEMKILHLREI